MPLKKYKKRIITILVAAIFIAVLSACGGSRDNLNTEAVTDEMPPCSSYTAEFTAIEEGIGAFTPVCFNGNGWYAVSMKKTGENIPQSVADDAARKKEAVINDGRYEVYSRELWFISEDGSIKQLEKYSPLEPEDMPGGWTDFDSVNNFGGMCTDEDGSLISVEYNYISGYDSDPKSGGNVFETVWYIRTLDPVSGQQREKYQIVNEDGAFFRADSMLYKNGNILMLAETEGQYLLSSITTKGIVNQSAKCSGYATKLISLSNGSAAVCSYDDGRVVIQEFDDNEYALKTLAESSAGLDSIYDGTGEYSFIYSCGWNFFGYDSETKSDRLILKWSETGTDYADIISGIETDSNGDYIFLTASSVVRLQKSEGENTAGRTEIKLLSCNPGQTLRKYVAEFNSENSDITIKIVDYSDYCPDGNCEAGLKKYLSQCETGQMPDILDLTGLNFRRLAAENILQDLYPYIDSDFGRQNYFQSVFTALEVNGKMCSSCAGFTIDTVIAPSRLTGGETCWSYDDYFEVKSSIDAGCSMFDTFATSDSIFAACMERELNQYIDWENVICSFNTESFIKLINFASSVECQNGGSESTDIRIYQGKQMLLRTLIYGMDDAVWSGFEFNEDISYPGFPCDDGTGNAFNISSIETGENFAILEESSQKSSAWKFIRKFFTEEYQREYKFFPANIQVFNNQLEEAKQVYYVLDENGEPVLGKKTGLPVEKSKGTMYLSDYTPIKYYAMTQSRADKLVNMINSTEKVISNDTDLLRIICAQVSNVFDGKITADEAAQNVQQVVTDYIKASESIYE